MRKSILGASFLILLVASAAVAQQADTIFTWSKSLPEGARFAIRNLNGVVDVRPGSGDRVEVRATMRVGARVKPDEMSVEVREHATNDVEICSVRFGLSACDQDRTEWNDNQPSLHYIIEVPKGLRIRAVTGNGNVYVMQTVAEVDVQTGNGDVVIREALTRGAASTGNGDVTFAAVNGPVRVSTGNGDIMINTATGPVDASSGNGSVSVRLPAQFNGELDASSGHGKIECDFDVRVRSRQDRSTLRGTIGGGGSQVIKLRSGNGRLEIRKG